MNYILSGHMPSDMDSIERLKGEDLFMISRYVQSNPDELEGMIGDVLRTRSYNVSYDTLSTRVLNDISAILGLSSMSRHDKNEYSKITHTHTYNHVEVQSYYGPSSPLYDPEEKFFYLGKIITVNNHVSDEISVCMPFVNPMDYVTKMDTKIGELRFVYLSSFNDLDRLKMTPEYGWVPTDGATYNKSDYISAFNVYKVNDGDTTFKVPNLNGFFRLNPGNEMNDPMKFVGHVSKNPPHVHTLEQSRDVGYVDVSAHMPFTTYRRAGKDIAAHCGGWGRHPMGEGAKAQGTITFDENSRLSGTGIEIYDCRTIGDEKTPTHNLMPCFVFIGEKNG